MKNGRPYILAAFDEERWCQVLATKIEGASAESLRPILGIDGKAGLDLDSAEYTLEPREIDAIERRFGARLELDALGLPAVRVILLRAPAAGFENPYLVHTGYELPLLLEGRKKLANMYWEYPPASFPGEESFDRWVERGALHKEIFFEPFDDGKLQGVRWVYYTQKGEEWRIPAFRMLRSAGVWNKHFERLEGMLYGYDDWQIDWWINARIGAWAGIACCCAVSSRGLEWIEAAGFKALPPCEKPHLTIAVADAQDDAFHELVSREPDAEALVRFNVPGRALMDVVDIRQAGPWLFPSDRIADLNKSLSGPVTVVARP